MLVRQDYHTGREEQTSLLHIQEAMKNLLLYLRDGQKAANREKRGYLLLQLNSHGKTIGAWALLCAKKQKTYAL